MGLHNAQTFRRVRRAVNAEVADDLSGVEVGGESDDAGNADKRVREVVEDGLGEFGSVSEATKARR